MKIKRNLPLPDPEGFHLEKLNMWTAAAPKMSDMEHRRSPLDIVTGDGKTISEHWAEEAQRGGPFGRMVQWRATSGLGGRGGAGAYRPPYRFPTAFSGWGEEEYRAIARVVASNRFTMGEETEAFEDELAAYHGVKHAICVNSGSSANLIAVAALFHVEHRPLQRGDKALVPGFAWATTYAPLLQYGLEPVLLDCGEDWNALTTHQPIPDRVRLVMLTHMLGTPAAAEGFANVARDHGCYLIEDACESIGAVTDLHGRRRVGTFGRMGTVSFYWSHQLSAIEGGAVITDDDECARLCRMLRDHGWTRSLREPMADLSDEYRFVLPGYNVRPVEMHCAIAREQLRKLDKHAARRRENLLAWQAACGQRGILTPRSTPGANPFGLPCLTNGPDHRQRAANALRAAGIDCRPVAGGSFAMQEMGVAYAGQYTPAADRIHREGICIGCPPWPARDWIETAARIISEAA